MFVDKQIALINYLGEKYGDMRMLAPHMVPVVMHVEAAGQGYRQTQSLIYPAVSTEITGWPSAR